MATVAERARELAEKLSGVACEYMSGGERYFDVGFAARRQQLFEQALLAERRLAKLEDAEIVKQFLDDEWVLTTRLSATTLPNKCAAKLRAAADKEVL